MAGGSFARGSLGKIGGKHENGEKSFGLLLIILAGIFWGSMGLFVRALSAYGFSPIQIVSLRLSVAALVFSGILLIKEPSGFPIRLRDLPVFLRLGLVSVLFFTVCCFTASDLRMQKQAAASTAAAFSGGCHPK